MSGDETKRVEAQLVAARCVQVGDYMRGRRVTAVEPGLGKAVRITTDDDRFVHFHMDELVRVAHA